MGKFGPRALNFGYDFLLVPFLGHSVYLFEQKLSPTWKCKSNRIHISHGNDRMIVVLCSLKNVQAFI